MAVLGAVLQEGAEGGDAGAGADHDDVAVGGGKMEMAGGLDVDGNGGGGGEIGEVTGGESLLGAAVGGVLDHGDGEVDLAGAVVGRRGNRVEAGSDLIKEGRKLGGVELHSGGVVEDVDDIAIKNVLIELLFIGTESLEFFAGGSGGLVGDGFDELFTRAVENDGGGENFAKGSIAGQS